MTTLAASFENLVRLFKQAGMLLSRRQYELFWSFDQLLRDANRDRDLTRITNFENTVIKHYIDCALVARSIELPSPLLDIGTGAGFPGIPIKIVNPAIRIILSEGRAKRAAFLKRAIGVLGLADIEVYAHKTTGRFGMPVSGVITRAFEKASETLKRVDPFLPDGGEVILMKGPNCEEERDEALRHFGCRFDLTRDFPYSIPGTAHRRRLLVFKKMAAVSEEKNLDTREEHGGVALKGSRHRLPKVVSSEDNELFKKIMSLHTARGVKKHSLALVSGQRYVREILLEFPERCEQLIFSSYQERKDSTKGVESVILTQELFRKADLFGTGGPLLVVRVEPMAQWTGEESHCGCTLALAFQDPANVGAAIRSAAAFGVKSVVLLREAAHPFHPRSIRAAGSTLMRMGLFQGPSINDLPRGSLPHVLLSPEGKDIADFEFPSSFCLLPGLEGKGLPEHLRSMELVSIPMEKGVESLNAAVATGIAIYCWRRQMEKSSRP